MGERSKVRGVFNTVPLIPTFSPWGRRRKAVGDFDTPLLAKFILKKKVRRLQVN